MIFTMPSAAASGKTRVSTVKFCFFGCKTAALNWSASFMFGNGGDVVE